MQATWQLQWIIKVAYDKSNWSSFHDNNVINPIISFRYEKTKVNSTFRYEGNLNKKNASQATKY